MRIILSFTLFLAISGFAVTAGFDDRGSRRDHRRSSPSLVTFGDELTPPLPTPKP